MWVHCHSKHVHPVYIRTILLFFCFIDIKQITNGVMTVRFVRAVSPTVRAEKWQWFAHVLLTQKTLGGMSCVSLILRGTFKPLIPLVQKPGARTRPYQLVFSKYQKSFLMGVLPPKNDCGTIRKAFAVTKIDLNRSETNE